MVLTFIFNLIFVLRINFLNRRSILRLFELLDVGLFGLLKLFLLLKNRFFEFLNRRISLNKDFLKLRGRFIVCCHLKFL